MKKSENVSQLLPKESRDIIVRALELYRQSLGGLIEHYDDIGVDAEFLRHEDFDCIGLIGMMKYDVEISLPEEDKLGFSSIAGVDFPNYVDKVKRMYPIEEESKWVTIVSGDFSFIDEGVYGRECHINSINTIEKHLRVHMNEVIDDIDSNGGGWLVLEDYDGSIEMNLQESTKEQTVELMDGVMTNSAGDCFSYFEYEEMKGAESRYNVKIGISEDSKDCGELVNEYDDIDLDRIQRLFGKEISEVVKNGIGEDFEDNEYFSKLFFVVDLPSGEKENSLNGKDTEKPEIRSEEDIKQKTEEDVQFIISAVTSELEFMAFNKYFETWERNGGMGWFFNECVSITNQIMFDGDTMYKKYLEAWKTSDDVSFFDIADDCIDWYHMNKAKELFESKYKEDEDTIPELAEHIGSIVFSFKDGNDRKRLLKEALEYVEKEETRTGRRQVNAEVH